MENQKGRERLDWLDYGRFIAAFAVMCFHYLYNGIRRDNITSITDFQPLTAFAKYGNLGLDFFFIISGFVIFYSAIGRTPQRFLADRFVRLFPAFLFCMTITALVRIFLGAPHFEVSFLQYIANLTMMPKKFGQEPIDGVYWTLYLEIVFYLWVFVLMAVNGLKKPQVAVEIWLAVIVFYELIGKSFPVLDGFSAYFAAGALFALVQRNGMSPRIACSLLVTFALSINWAIEKAHIVSVGHGTIMSPYVVSGITTLFFAAFLLFTTTGLRNARLPYAAFIGGLTYPVYLLHAYIGYILLSRFGADEHKWTAVVAMMATVLAGSAFVLIFIERKPHALYRRLASKFIEHPVERRLEAASTLLKKKKITSAKT